MGLFAKSRKRWLSQFIDLSEGIPSHQTLARVFSLIEPLEFKRGLGERVAEISQLVAEDLIAIDGKTSRGSAHERGARKPLI